MLYVHTIMNWDEGKACELYMYGGDGINFK